MKPSLGRNVTGMVALAAMAGALTLGAGGIALAQQASPPQSDAAPEHDGYHGHHEGILGRALALSSLTGDQRTAIERLVQTRRAAEAPVKQADARLLTVLATQVEQASVNPQALAPDLQARDGAATAARAVDRETLQQLHDLLTPAQRGALVDAMEAGDAGGYGHRGHEQLAHMEQRLGLTEQQEALVAANLRAERAGHQGGPDGGRHGHPGAGKQAWLESFRTDSFNATASGGQPWAGHRGDHMEHLMQAMVPVLTPAQRAELAAHLRHRAARESRT
jgi:Spy/CpxP family protein refolding chaperone